MGHMLGPYLEHKCVRALIAGHWYAPARVNRLSACLCCMSEMQHAFNVFCISAPTCGQFLQIVLCSHAKFTVAAAVGGQHFMPGSRTDMSPLEHVTHFKPFLSRLESIHP